ncbi:MAG: hypothetical protein ABJD66_11640, partial [Cellulophaga sp.]|uniref:hypothetical protein n=1 Tax=Cellulophaga sp. TaxID=1972202 RepID=UPI003267C91E
MIEFLSERTKDRTNTLRLIDGDFSLNKLEDSISLKDIANIKALESKGYAMYKDKVYLNDSINAYKNIEDYFNLIEVSQAVDYINLNINSTKTIFDILSVDSYYTDYVYSPVYIIKKLSYEDGSSTNINDTLREFDFIKPDKFESSKKLKSILINIEFDYPIVNQYNLNRENNIGTIEREKVRLTKMSNKSLQLILPTSINERIVGINPICYNGKVLQKKSGGSSTLFPRNHQEKWLNFNKKMKQKVINNTFI